MNQQEQLEDYVRSLYQPKDVVEVVGIKPGENVRRGTRTIGDDVDLLLKQLRAFEAKGYNVYMSALPRAIQATKMHDRIWVDQDDPNQTLPSDLPTPNTLVSTSLEGRGYRWQAIWLLEEAITADRAKQVMKQLADRLGADGSVHDSRRILRIPGFVNAKRGMPAVLLSSHSQPVSLDLFDLPEVDTPLAAMMNTTVNNPSAVLGEWLSGISEGERNRVSYVCARFLKSCGVPEGDALSIVALGASRCEPPLMDSEVRNSVRSAYNG